MAGALQLRAGLLDEGHVLRQPGLEPVVVIGIELHEAVQQIAALGRQQLPAHQFFQHRAVGHQAAGVELAGVVALVGLLHARRLQLVLLQIEHPRQRLITRLAERR